jgi:hypothetical protein
LLLPFGNICTDIMRDGWLSVALASQARLNGNLRRPA